MITKSSVAWPSRLQRTFEAGACELLHVRFLLLRLYGRIFDLWRERLD